MVSNNLWLNFLRERIADDEAFLAYFACDIGRMQELREKVGNDWQVEELMRAILFEEAAAIALLKGGIEDDRRQIRRIQRRTD